MTSVRALQNIEDVFVVSVNELALYVSDLQSWPKVLGTQCTFKQGNGITLIRKANTRKKILRSPIPQPMLKSSGSILASGLNIVWVGGRGGEEG